MPITCPRYPRVARDLNLAMDSSFSPCTNFTQFACGGYESNFAGKKYLSSWGVVESLQEEVHGTIRQIMEQSGTQNL